MEQATIDRGLIGSFFVQLLEVLTSPAQYDSALPFQLLVLFKKGQVCPGIQFRGAQLQM